MIERSISNNGSCFKDDYLLSLKPKEVKYLDDYRYNEKTNEIIHIIEVRTLPLYSTDNGDIQIPIKIYLFKSSDIHNNQQIITSLNYDKWFWSRYKRLSKLKAILLYQSK